MHRKTKSARKHEGEEDNEPNSETTAVITEGFSSKEVASKTSSRPKCCIPTVTNNIQDDEADHIELAARETKVVNCLRATVMLFFLTTATIVCTGVYAYTRDSETKQYEQKFENDAIRIIAAFHDGVERKLGAASTLSTQMTSYAKATNRTFPFVTVPDFALRGADMRTQADAIIVHWMPLVTDDTRLEWEEYAFNNRFHIDQAFKEDTDFRKRQDEFFGLLEEQEKGSQGSNGHHASTTSGGQNNNRNLQPASSTPERPSKVLNETILDDGTGYHPKIWSVGAVDPRGDYAEGTGPFLPLWQRSPISGAKQGLLNMNFATSRALSGALEVMLETKEAVMNTMTFPVPAILPVFKANLEISQYRHDVESVLEAPLTFFSYPVFDSFSADRELAGVLAINIYWKVFFQNILQPSDLSIICILENSFGQTSSYLIDGPDPTYLGDGDFHDPELEYLEQFADVNSYVENIAGPTTRSYLTVPLNKEYGKYRLKVYPARGPQYSDRPWVYMIVVASTFVFTAIIFVLFSLAVEQRQRVVMDSAIQNAKRAATAAQELNEFLSHEVRNPLSAAISACTFVKSSLEETECITDPQFRASLEDDVKIISTSLSFVSDFLRSMLDLHRAQGHRIEMKLSPTDVLTDILDPISNMFYQRHTGVEILVECPQNLVVTTDCLRLKQVILNLGRNAAKFVESGFIRFRAEVVDEKLEIYVEDTGPGIPKEKQENMFQKFQTSLDVLNQGTGLGLSLCKSLVDLLDGEIWLDETYNSGFDGGNSPGARFVIRLNGPLVFGGGFGCDSIRSLRSSTRDGTDPCGLLNHDDNTADIAIVATGNTCMIPTGSAENQVTSSVAGEDQAKTDPDPELTLPQSSTVLFVDDSMMLRKLFSRAIKKVAPEWTIQEAANGETALRMVDSQQYDLIFIDQYMASTEKVLLGTETVRALRSKGVTSLLCGLSANDLESSFLAAGADAFIMKPMPCEKVELTRELLRIMPQHYIISKQEEDKEEKKKEDLLAVVSEEEKVASRASFVQCESNVDMDDENDERIFYA